MEEPPSSSTSRTKAKAKDTQMCFSGFDAMNEDLLFNILTRLPAQSFASAACVSKSWNHTCNRVLSRPKLASALSLKSSLPDALKEVFDKILSEPIRPHFVIAYVGNGFELLMTLRLIRKKLGNSVPIIVSVANGIIGRDALTNELKEVNWHDILSDFNNEADLENEGIVMTVGFFPGLKVDAIPLARHSTLSMRTATDRFVGDIKEYSASVSRCSFPQGILLFGEGSTNMKTVMDKLDCAMPKDTFIVGDERGRVAYRSGNNFRNSYARTGYLVEAVALVFVQDRNRSPATGEIKFHVALSNGVIPMGNKYKTASVRTSTEGTTWLTAKREGQQEILDGQRILDDLGDEFTNLIEIPSLYIGVYKRRKLTIGSEKPYRRISITFHGVESVDEQYMYVDGTGLRTGDTFQLYLSDRNAGLASCARVSEELKKIELEANFKNLSGGAGNATSVFGGLIFTCGARGVPFFGRPNVDSSAFADNFPGVPLSGVFCGGELARTSFPFNGQCKGASDVDSISSCVHVYSCVYLLMSYTSPP